MSLSRCISEVSCRGFSVDLVVQHYTEWVILPFYVVVSGYNGYTQENEYACFRSPKRGDERYARRLLGRFEGLSKTVPNVTFFPFGERDRRKIASPCVLATLTYDPSTCSIEDSWLSAGRDFNRWITRLRKRFGKIDVVRVFESHESGYSHIHALLYFRERSWRGFRWDSWKNGKRVTKYRADKVESLKVGWRGGFADVLLMSSTRAGFGYLTKYLSKSVDFKAEDSKAVKTLALSWFFRKRSFSISGHLAQQYSDLIKQLSNNSNLTCDIELAFDGSVVFCGVTEWNLYGFVKGLVDGWGDHWQKISRTMLVELEESGRIEIK
jgi:hypothetical protein